MAGNQKRTSKDTPESEGAPEVVTSAESDVRQPPPPEHVPFMPKRNAYKKVIFSERASDADPVDVLIARNGTVFGCKRGVEVIAPQWVLDLADNTTYDRYTIIPGVGRKVIGKIKRFNYQVLGDATKEQYELQVAKGNREWNNAQESIG